MPGPPESINTSLFVFHIDVVLLGLFALYVVSTLLPRVLVYLFQHSEILNGFFLRSESGAAPRVTFYYLSDIHGSPDATKTSLTSPSVPTVAYIPEKGLEGENGENSEAQHPALIIPPRAAAAAHIKGSPSRLPAPSPRRVPTLVLCWMRILRPTIVYSLNFRVGPGISFGKLLVFIVYTAIMLYASLRPSNPLAYPGFMGYLAISQVPIIVALVGKTNWLGLACRLGYEKV
jgi:ferric-chelate reductase